MERLLKLARMFEWQIVAGVDLIPGGKADRMEPSDFDPEQLEFGVREEMEEHTNNPQIAREIVMDHLSEDRDYYRKVLREQTVEFLTELPDILLDDQEETVKLLNEAGLSDSAEMMSKLTSGQYQEFIVNNIYDKELD